MESLFTIQNLLALITLTAMEIILGIDNIIFIAILVAKVPKAEQFRVRSIGIFLALFFRIALLCSLNWVMSLTGSLIQVAGHDFSGRDILLLGGGLFLVAKSTIEIHQKITQAGLPHSDGHTSPGKARQNFWSVIIQVMIIDIVFSLDSIITAVGMAQSLVIMILAVIVSMLMMLGISGPISNFVEKNPTIKILALAFLIMIGVMLLMEGMGNSVSKGYVYFAMAFSLGVEMLNLQYVKRTKGTR